MPITCFGQTDTIYLYTELQSIQSTVIRCIHSVYKYNYLKNLINDMYYEFMNIEMYIVLFLLPENACHMILVLNESSVQL